MSNKISVAAWNLSIKKRGNGRFHLKKKKYKKDGLGNNDLSHYQS